MSDPMLLTFSLAVLAMIAAPGPSLLLVCHSTACSGLSAGLSSTAGSCTAATVHGALAIAGLSAIIATSLSLFMVLKLVGASYLLYLGALSLRAWRNHRAPGNSIVGSHPAVSLVVAYRRALLAGLLNPYSIVFFISVFPQFVPAGVSTGTPTVWLMLAYATALRALWFGGMALFLGKLTVCMESHCFYRGLHLVSGLMLITLGANAYRVSVL